MNSVLNVVNVVANLQLLILHVNLPVAVYSERETLAENICNASNHFSIYFRK